MAQVRDAQSEGTLAPFIIISTLLHILFVIFYPQWQTGPIPSSLPGSGVLQFTLREAPQARFVALQPVLRPTNVPTPAARPAPQPAQQQPAQQQQKTVTTTPAQVAAAPAQVPTPQARPQTPPQVSQPARQPVQAETPAAPTPEARPAPRGEETGKAANVVTSPQGTVPVATGTAETTTGIEPRSDEAAFEVSAPVTETEPVSEPVAEAAPPPPPPPPPTVGSMLSFPGGTYLPKAYTAAWGTVSVRVWLTVDERGQIIDAQIDPAMRAADELINQEALLYARRFVEAKPGPEGQAYRAAVVVTFGQQGTTFATDPDERIDLVGSGR